MIHESRARLGVAPDRLAGVVIVVFGAWFLWQAATLREGPGYAAIGPRAFPLLVGVGILGSGIALAAAPPRHTEPSDEDALPPVDYRTLLGAGAILAGYVILFAPVGFILASTAFVVASSWNLGSRSVGRDLAAGFATSLVAYVVFTRLLGLELPGGPLPL